MAWVTITETDLRTRLSDPEITRWKSYFTGPGKTDPVPGIITQVVDEVRGYVAVRNTLGDGATVPSKLVSTAVVIIRHRFLNSLPGVTISEDRKKEYEEARALLERVADGKFAVEEPTTASGEAQSDSLGPSVGERDRKFTSDDEEGI